LCADGDTWKAVIMHEEAPMAPTAFEMIMLICDRFGQFDLARESENCTPPSRLYLRCFNLQRVATARGGPGCATRCRCLDSAPRAEAPKSDNGRLGVVSAAVPTFDPLMKISAIRHIIEPADPTGVALAVALKPI